MPFSSLLAIRSPNELSIYYIIISSLNNYLVFIRRSHTVDIDNLTQHAITTKHQYSDVLSFKQSFCTVKCKKFWLANFVSIINSSLLGHLQLKAADQVQTLVKTLLYSDHWHTVFCKTHALPGLSALFFVFLLKTPSNSTMIYYIMEKQTPEVK